MVRAGRGVARANSQRPGRFGSLREPLEDNGIHAVSGTLEARERGSFHQFEQGDSDMPMVFRGHESRRLRQAARTATRRTN